MTDTNPGSTIPIDRSGGADLNAGRDITVGGDVVGHDKVESHATTNTATVIGSGTVVQGDGAVAAGAGGVAVGGDVHGDVKVTNITGDQQYDVHGLANPYLGLQSFTYAAHAKYAGREKLIAETVTRLTAPDDPLALLFVTGASGSGKSSFVQAGVLPALEKHYAALNVKWAVFRPSRDPLAALADAVWRQLGLPQFDTQPFSPTDFGNFLRSNTPPQQVNVIVIDQFEELFTQSNAQPRDALFALLTQLLPFRSTRTHIIATVRADYLPELFALPALYDIAKRGIDLRAMSVDELREAIQQPLRATYPDKDKRFQAELVERLAHDSAEDAAYLPLLQVTLEEIWRKGTLTVGSYNNLADAIKQRADKVLAYQDYDAAQSDQLRTPEEQAAILNLCLDLVDVSLDDEARRDVRRRRSKDELTSGAPDRAQLIDALTQARLFSVGAESGESSHVEVDLIHETLLSNWERLRQAISGRRHELRQRVRFEQQLKEWIGQDRSDDYLLGGVRLAEARDLERREDIALYNADAKDFVRRSVEREEARRQKELDDVRRLAEETEARRQAEAERRQEAERAALRLKTRNRITTAAVVVAALLAIVAGVFGIQSNQAANVNATLAVQNQSIANAAQTAEAKAVSAASSRATAESNALVQRDEAQRQARLAISGELAAQVRVRLEDEPDLALLLGVESFATADTFQARDSLLTALMYRPRLTRFLRRPDNVSSLTFGPDGKTLASGNCITRDKNRNCLAGGITLWDTMSGQPSGKLLTSRDLMDVPSLAFSPDGKILASGSYNHKIILWDIFAGQPISQQLVGHTTGVLGLTFSPDGKILASGGCNALSLPGGLCDRGEIILWDMPSGKIIGQPIIGHVTTQNDLVFSPDGRILVWGDCGKIEKDSLNVNRCTGGEINVLDVTSRELITRPLSGTLSAITSVAFNADGKSLATGDAEGKIQLWDMATWLPIGHPIVSSNNSRYVGNLAFSPDGKTLFSSSWGEAISVWDAASGKPIGVPLAAYGRSFFTERMIMSLDGKTLASSGCGQYDSSRFSCLQGVIFLWDTTSDPPLGQTIGNSSINLETLNSYSEAFSPDGKILASGNCTGHESIYNCIQGEIRLWEITNNQLISQTLTGYASDVYNLSFSADGQTLASVSCREYDKKQKVYSCAQSEFRLWDVAGQRLVYPPFIYDQRVSGMTLSPDGKVLAADGQDDTIVLWDVASGQPLGQPLPAFLQNTMTFSPDGKVLAATGCTEFFQSCSQGEIRFWEVANQRLISQPITGIVNYVGSGALAFSPNGKILATTSTEGIILVDMETKHVGLPLVGSVAPMASGGIRSLVFSPDGKILAAGSCESTSSSSCGRGVIHLWDTATGQLFSQSFKGHINSVRSLAFSPDGKILMSGSGQNTVIRWDVDPASWQMRACRIANRNLTQAEWKLYMGDEPYRKTCDQWPLEPELTPTP